MAGPKCPYSEVPLYHIIFVSVSADSKDLRGYRLLLLVMDMHTSVITRNRFET